jgi:hypothetical protein
MGNASTCELRAHVIAHMSRIEAMWVKIDILKLEVRMCDLSYPIGCKKSPKVEIEVAQLKCKGWQLYAHIQRETTYLEIAQNRLTEQCDPPVEPTNSTPSAADIVRVAEINRQFPTPPTYVILGKRRQHDADNIPRKKK